MHIVIINKEHTWKFCSFRIVMVSKTQWAPTALFLDHRSVMRPLMAVRVKNFNVPIPKPSMW